MKELQLRGHQVEDQDKVVIRYKQFAREEPLRFNLRVNGCLLVEAKAVEQVHPIHKAQLLSYMKLLDIPLGLIINFHELKLTDGVSRLSFPVPTSHNSTHLNTSHSPLTPFPPVQKRSCCYSAASLSTAAPAVRMTFTSS